MTFYIIATIIIFLVVASVTVGLIKSYLNKKDDKKMYYFIRNFRNGPIFYVYGLLFLVFLIGVLHNNIGVHRDLLYNIFKSVTDSLIMTVEAVVFKYQLDNIQVLMDKSLLYRILVFVIFVLSSFSSFVFVTSFFGRNIYNNKRLVKALNQDTLYVIIGFNKQNYKLLDESKNIIYVDCVATEEKDSKVRKAKIDGIKEELYLSNITFKILDDYSDIPVFINDLSEKGYKDLRVIVNTGDENLNVNLINEFHKSDNDQFPTLSLSNLSKLNYYVFGSSKFSSIYMNIAEKSKGRIHFVNTYKMIADSFEYNYPLTRFMNENHIDYSKAILKNDVDVNVFMVGFGNVNKHIFMNSVRNNQFITLDNNVNEIHKPVNYYIFEKEKNNYIDNNLNFTYLRFKNEYPKKGFEDDYYDDVTAPANEHIINNESVAVESDKFYKVLEGAIEGPNGSSNKTFNYIIVSCGEDLYNLDIAKKIRQKAIEWDLVSGSEVKIFVKIKNDDISNIAKLEEDNIYQIIPFASESEVLSLNNIVNVKLENIALRRHITYTHASFSLDNIDKIKDAKKKEKSLKKRNDILKEISDFKDKHDKKNTISLNTEEEIVEAIALYNWFYKWASSKRDSNMYSALNIRFKLNLLGLDLDEKYDEKTYSELAKVYKETYGDNRRYDLSSLVIKGARRNLGIQEHYRWNAYMICNGFVPARFSKINELYSKYGSDYKNIIEAKRYHANITTIKGLEDFMMHMAYLNDSSKFTFDELKDAIFNKDMKKREKLIELSTDYDVIKYDFEFMDEIIDVLPKIDMGLNKHRI